MTRARVRARARTQIDTRTDDLWKAPRLWPDRTCYILGGGVSLNKIDFSRLYGQRVIAVNHAYKLGPWDAMFFNDRHFFTVESRSGLLDFPGLIVTTNRHHSGRPRVLVMKRKNIGGGGGIITNPHTLVWNLSSGACAINLAVHFGVRRIILFGFDMRRVSIKENDIGLAPDAAREGWRCNWHEPHPTTDAKKNPYPRFLVPFKGIARDLKKIGVDCINATPGSLIKVFPIVKPEEVYP